MSPELEALVRAYGRSNAIVRKKVLDVIRVSWNGLADYRDMNAWVRFVIPYVEAGSAQTAALTDAYLAQYEALSLGTDPTPLGVQPSTVTTEALRGVPASEVYQRPGQSLYTALGNGTPFEQAVKMGLDRAIDLASTDMQLAKTHTSRRVIEDKDYVIGHRRVLTGNKSCGLCVVASTQRYHKANLQPCHPGCDCGVQPIYDSEDAGHVHDPETLAAAHQSIADRFGGFSESARGGDGIPDYRDVLITHEHGEIGPVLAVRGQHFTSEAQLT